MMNSRERGTVKKLPTISIIFLLALGLVPTYFGASRPGSNVTIKAGDLTGEVVSTVGKRIENIPVKLLDGGGTVVTETKSNADGEYLFPGVKRGTYTIAVGDKMTYQITVYDSVGTSSLTVVVPEGYSAGFIKENPLSRFARRVFGFGTSTKAGGVIVFATAAVVGGTVAAAGGGGGGSSSSTAIVPSNTTVSPP